MVIFSLRYLGIIQEERFGWKLPQLMLDLWHAIIQTLGVCKTLLKWFTWRKKKKTNTWDKNVQPHLYSQYAQLPCLFFPPFEIPKKKNECIFYNWCPWLSNSALNAPVPGRILSFIWAVNDHHLCAFSFLNNTYKWTFGPIFLCAFCTMLLECPSARQRQGQSLLPSLSAHQTPLSLGAL